MQAEKPHSVSLFCVFSFVFLHIWEKTRNFAENNLSLYEK